MYIIIGSHNNYNNYNNINNINNNKKKKNKKNNSNNNNNKKKNNKIFTSFGQTTRIINFGFQLLNTLIFECI